MTETTFEDIDLHPPQKEEVVAVDPMFSEQDVSDDDGVINLTQRMRVKILSELSPNGGKPKNYKDNRILVDLLRDTSITVQSRITSRKDRALISPELIAALAAQIQHDQPAYSTVEREPPRIDRPLSNRTVTKEVTLTAEHKETFHEFENRTKDIDVTSEDE